jgi:hypothetical protein
MKKAYIVEEKGIAIVPELIARTVSGSFFTFSVPTFLVLVDVRTGV